MKRVLCGLVLVCLLFAGTAPVTAYAATHAYWIDCTLYSSRLEKSVDIPAFTFSDSDEHDSFIVYAFYMGSDLHVAAVTFNAGSLTSLANIDLKNTYEATLYNLTSSGSWSVANSVSGYVPYDNIFTYALQNGFEAFILYASDVVYLSGSVCCGIEGTIYRMPTDYSKIFVEASVLDDSALTDPNPGGVDTSVGAAYDVLKEQLGKLDISALLDTVSSALSFVGAVPQMLSGLFAFIPADLFTWLYIGLFAMIAAGVLKLIF